MIALIAHDSKKADLVTWVGRHHGVIRRHELVATGTTGAAIMAAHPDLHVLRLASGPLGGDQQIGAMIVGGEITALVFFVDPLTPMPHDVDVKALMRLAILYDVPAAFSPRTADAVIGSLGAARPAGQEPEARVTTA